MPLSNRAMTKWRTLIHDHRKLAGLLILFALFVKALIPAGYMVGPSSRFLTVQICADGLSAKSTHSVEIPMDKESPKPAGKHSEATGICAFSSLAMGGMSAADTVQLGLALVFILLLGFAPTAAFRPRQALHLRPPLRGPPVAA